MAPYIILRDLLIMESWMMLTDSKFGHSIRGYEGFLAFQAKSLVFGIAVVCHDSDLLVDYAGSKLVATRARAGWKISHHCLQSMPGKSQAVEHMESTKGGL